MTTVELVGMFVRSREERHMQPATIRWYRSVLGNWARLGLDNPTRADVQKWLGMAPSASTARSWRRALRAFYHWCDEEYGPDAFVSGRGLVLSIPNPTLGVKPPPNRTILPRIFSKAECARIRAACYDIRDQVAIEVLLDTGMRVGQLHSIRWDRVEVMPMDDHVLYAVSVVGKTGDHRCPLSEGGYRALQRIARGPGPVFRSLTTGEQLTVDGLKSRIRNVFKRAGLHGRKLGPHTLRHTFATNYLLGGGELHELQRVLGHATIAQTMVYAHLADRHVFEAHARFSLLQQLDDAAAGGH